MSTLDHTLKPEPTVRRLEVITGTGRRRQFSEDFKAEIVGETLAPDAVVSEVARRHGLTPQQVFTWRRQARRTAVSISGTEAPQFVPAVVEASLLARTPQHGRKRSRRAERTTGIIEVEIDGVTVQVGRGADPPGVVYVYAPDRKADRPIAHLAGFKGCPAGRWLWRLSRACRAWRCETCLLLVPCSPALLRTRRGGPRTDCQRDPRNGSPASTRSRTTSAARSAEERRAIRQERSRPVIDELEPWLRAKLALISQKSKLAEAIRYALSRWEGLTRFLDDGCVEIDSNVVERAIRPIALSRKNALFAGSDGGGEHWAIIASLIETCKLGGVDPHVYLADVITRIINGHPNNRIDELLP